MLAMCRGLIWLVVCGANVKDHDDLCVPVWVDTTDYSTLGCNHRDKGGLAWVDRVLSASHIVARVVHAKDFVAVDAITDDLQLEAVVRSKLLCIVNGEDPGYEVVFEISPKVLTIYHVSIVLSVLGMTYGECGVLIVLDDPLGEAKWVVLRMRDMIMHMRLAVR